ncbi:MAG: porin [Candidatus Latescibacterota bacterium]
MLNRWVLQLMAAMIACQAGAAEATDTDRISGIMFADYYAILSADDGDVNLPEKRNAFRFRRIYFNYDHSLSERVDFRFRLEANDAGFGFRAKMEPFVKHAYLKWKGALGGNLYVGESGTPTWALVEQTWGYRAVEKTLLDLNGIGSSADVGLAFKAHTGGATYHVMVANGPGQRPERDNGKKLYASVQFHPGENQIELYGDVDMLPGGDELTLKAFLGRVGDGFHGGVESFMRINKEAALTDPGEDVTRIGLSVFGALPLRDNWKGFARVDAVDDDDLDTTDLLLVGGLDWKAEEEVHIMPALIIQIPDGPDPNIQVRVTGMFKF